MTRAHRRFPLRAAAGLLAALALSGPHAPVRAQQEQADGVSRENALIVARLFRTALVALHQANVTGNYTVLRDLAAPSFHERNSAADLAGIFADIRREKIDLGAAAVIDPRLVAAPRVDEQGFLRFGGTLATQPTAIAFELAFQAVDNQWRLFGVSITPIRAPAAAAPPAAKAAPKQTTKSPAPPASLTRDPWLFPGGPSGPLVPPR